MGYKRCNYLLSFMSRLFAFLKQRADHNSKLSYSEATVCIKNSLINIKVATMRYYEH